MARPAGALRPLLTKVETGPVPGAGPPTVAVPATSSSARVRHPFLGRGMPRGPLWLSPGPASAPEFVRLILPPALLKAVKLLPAVLRVMPVLAKATRLVALTCSGLAPEPMLPLEFSV